MRKTMLILAVAAAPILALLLAAAPARSADFGTAAEAKAMLEKAIAELKADEAGALVKFNTPDGGFRDRDLYVFCFNRSDGKFTAHMIKQLIGLDVRTFKLRDDPLGQRFFDSAKEGTITAIDYLFPKPGTTEPVPKESFITAVGSQGCGVGYYKG